MRIGYEWLRDYIAFEWSPEELADQLTAIGTAVDGIDPVFDRFSNVRIGRIEKCETHPRRPDLCVLQVNIKSGTQTMVSGAPNCRVGLLIAAALPEAELPGMSGERLGIREIDGIKSEGMCCSEKELGLSDDRDALMELDQEIFTVGDDLWKALKLDEVSMSFELTPNRGDCLSVIGIAREIAALSGGKLRRPEFRLNEIGTHADSLLEVVVEDAEGCPRYAGRLIRGGQVGKSPFWLKRRLRSAGMRPINNAVDITNFVMLETGQPLHAFDWSRFPGGRVVVRTASAGEKFTTLDDVERTLPAGAVMITNGDHPVAIGGVMGGAESEVSLKTTDFLIESAHFEASRIRRTRTRLGMATESALRFEKGVDPNGVIFAVDRAADLFASLTGGEILAGVVDNYPQKIDPLKIDLDPERANRILGTSMSTPTMIDILSNLEFGIVTGKPPTITVPTFRSDVTREIDLIEEVARVYGYEKIPVDRRGAGVLPTARHAPTDLSRTAREILEGLGLNEILGNSMTDPSSTHVPESDHANLRNPLSADLAIMRPDLIGTALTVIAHNRNRQVESVPIYEIGRVFCSPKGNGVYEERTELMIALCGQAPTSGWDEPRRAYDFYDLKGVVREFLERWADKVRLETVEDLPPFAKGEGFALLVDGQTWGHLGRIADEYAARLGVKDPVWVATIDFERLTSIDATTRKYRHLPRFPAAFRDLAVVVDPAIPVAELIKSIEDAGGELLEEVRLFDRYAGKSIANGKVSYAFSISYRRPDQTLTDEEVEKSHASIVARLEKDHGATLR